MYDDLTEQQEALVSRMCHVLAKSTVSDLANEIDKLSIPPTHKTSILLTVQTSMLNRTLNVLYEGKTDDDGLLKKKLEFLRVIRHAFVREHKINKEEKTNDNG
jgi:hypothetical protein